MNLQGKTDLEIVETAGGGVGTGSQGAQAEMMRRLKDSIEKLDQSTSNFSRALFALSLLLFIVAILQLFISIFSMGMTIWESIGLELVVGITILYFTRRIFNVVLPLTNESKQKEDKK
jgi:hypothetical protein